MYCSDFHSSLRINYKTLKLGCGIVLVGPCLIIMVQVDLLSLSYLCILH